MTNENKPAESTPAAAPQGGAPAPHAGPRRPGGPRRHFAPRRKVCRLCADKIAQIDYKQVQFLKTYTTDTGKVLPRRITGACAKHQRQIMRAIKVNRNLSILPYSA